MAHMSADPTPPDFTDHYQLFGGPRQARACVAASLKKFERLGVALSRTTMADDGTLYVEGWLLPPDDQTPPPGAPT